MGLNTWVECIYINCHNKTKKSCFCDPYNDHHIINQMCKKLRLFTLKKPNLIEEGSDSYDYFWSTVYQKYRWLHFTFPLAFLKLPVNFLGPTDLVRTCIIVDNPWLFNCWYFLLLLINPVFEGPELLIYSS